MRRDLGGRCEDRWKWRKNRRENWTKKKNYENKCDYNVNGLGWWVGDGHLFCVLDAATDFNGLMTHWRLADENLNGFSRRKMVIGHCSISISIQPKIAPKNGETSSHCSIVGVCATIVWLMKDIIQWMDRDVHSLHTSCHHNANALKSLFIFSRVPTTSSCPWAVSSFAGNDKWWRWWKRFIFAMPEIEINREKNYFHHECVAGLCVFFSSVAGTGTTSFLASF